MMKAAVLAMVCAGLASVSVAAVAQAQDSVVSEALFNRGVADMEAGRFDNACPAIAESLRLDPRPGTLFTLAECEAKWGKIASAITDYTDYLGLVSRMSASEHAAQADREKISREQIEKLRPQLPHLTLVLPAGAPADVAVKRDGTTLTSVSLGIELPVDPGDHLIVTQVPGGPEHTQHVTLGPGERKRLELEMAPPRANRVVPSAASNRTRSTASAYPQPRARSGSHDRTWAWVAGGIGVAGVSVGTVTGLMSMSKKKTVDDNCTGSVCNAEGKSAADTGKMLGTTSTVSYGVGLAGLATSVLLWLTAPQVSTTESARHRWVPMLSGGVGSETLVGVEGSW